MLDIKSSYYAYVKKGALIKSYRYSHALITPRPLTLKPTHLHTHLSTKHISHIPINKCVNLYLGNVKIYLIRIQCRTSSSRCVLTATIRCVFKTSNVTRFQMEPKNKLWWASNSVQSMPCLHPHDSQILRFGNTLALTPGVAVDLCAQKISGKNFIFPKS